MSALAHGLLQPWLTATAVGAVLLGLLGLVVEQTGARRLGRRPRSRQPVR